MSDQNDSPGPDGDGPAGPDPEHTDNAPGAMEHVRAAWQTPGGKLLAVVPAVVMLVLGGVVRHVARGRHDDEDRGGTGREERRHRHRDRFRAFGADVIGGRYRTQHADRDRSLNQSGTQTSSLPTGPATAGIVPLTDLTPASGTWQSHDANPMLNGTLQQFAIIQDIPDENANGDVGYNLGRDYTKFTGLIGLDDNSPKSTLHPTIEIDGDGLKIATYTPTLGHPAQINLDVTGVLRLDIKYTSLDSNGYGNLAGILVLGNGQLTAVPGYHPPTPSSS